MEVNFNAKPKQVQAPNTTKLHRAEVMVGPHQVKLGNNPPIRLDKIGHSYIKPLGIRKQTRMANTARGMAAQSNLMLGCLKREDATLNAAGFLKALNTFNEYARYQLKTGLVENAGTVNVSGMIDAVVELSNADITSIYATLLSQDMDDLKMAMEHEARTNPKARKKMVAALNTLMDLEAVLVSEASKRTALATLPSAQTANMLTVKQQFNIPDVNVQVTHRGDNDLRAPGMAEFIGHAALSAHDVKAADEQYTRSAMAHMLTPVDVRKLGDVMRNAELTVNISPNILFGDGKDPNAFAVNDENFGLKNMFQLREENLTHETLNYQLLRETAENAMFPTLRGHVAGKERPIYGALNLMQNIAGACSTYGRAVLVLKPQLKQTATYTFGDTLAIPYVKLQNSTKLNFVSSMLQYRDILTPETQQDLQTPDSELRKAIDSLFETQAEQTIEDLTALKQFNTMMGLLKFQPEHDNSVADKQYFVQNSLLRSCQVKDKNFKQVASYDHLESLLPAMEEGNILQLDVSQRKNIPAIHIQGADYIEAQLATPMNLRRDVAEIRMHSADFTKEARDNIRKWGEEAGVKITFFTEKYYGNQVYDVSEKAKKLGEEVRDIHHDHAVKKARELLVNYNPVQPAENYLAQHPKYDILHKLVGDKPVLRGALAGDVPRVLYNAMKDTDKLTSLGYIEQQHVNQQATTAIKRLLDQKFALLLKLNDLPFDNDAQKLAFANWVLESKALKTEDEMLLFYNGMTQNAREITRFLDGPDAQNPVKFNETLAELHLQNVIRFDDYNQKLGEDEPNQDNFFTQFNRFAFLTLGQIKCLPDGNQKLQNLAKLIGSQEYKTMKMTCDAITEKTVKQRLNTEDSNKLFTARALSTYMTVLGNSMSAQLKLPPFGELDTMDLSAIPEALRQKTIALMPEVSEVVERLWPPTGEARIIGTFHKPAPNSIPQTTLAQRRDFLREQLEIYHQHDKSFDHSTDYHGRTHAVRVFIFANVLCNILKKMGIDVDTNAVCFAAAGHDTGRQAHGPDKWEADSAAICRKAVEKATNNPGNEYLKDIQKCITSEDKTSPTLEALLLHSADSMDYSRVGDVKMEFFPFLRETIVQGGKIIPADEDGKFRAALIREAKMLAKLTHPATGSRSATTQLFLEYTSDVTNLEAKKRLDDLKDALAKETAHRADTETNDQVLQRIEDIVRTNKSLFPLLNEFYKD